MEKKLCNYVMKYIDEEEENKMPDNLKRHLKECKKCNGYLLLSLELREYGRNYEEVNLFPIFRERAATLHKKNFYFHIRVGITTVSIALLIFLGLFLLNSGKKENVEASFNEVEYFYTIATEL